GVVYRLKKDRRLEAKFGRRLYELGPLIRKKGINWEFDCFFLNHSPGQGGTRRLRTGQSILSRARRVPLVAARETLDRIAPVRFFQYPPIAGVCFSLLAGNGWLYGQPSSTLGLRLSGFLC